jgi:ribosomal protein L9
VKRKERKRKRKEKENREREKRKEKRERKESLLDKEYEMYQSLNHEMLLNLLHD